MGRARRTNPTRAPHRPPESRSRARARRARTRLQNRHWLHGMSPADRRRSCFGQPEVPDLARLEQEASLWAAPLDGPFERAEREMPVIHRTQGPADDEPPCRGIVQQTVQ
jgi:hypothetical protein